MRLIGTLDEEKKAYTFYSFLLKEGVQNTYESFVEPQTGKRLFRIWITEEDDLEVATQYFEQFIQNPKDFKFESKEEPTASSEEKAPSSDDPLLQAGKWKVKLSLRKSRYPLSLSLTHFLLLLCVLVFIWDDVQERQMRAAKGGDRSLQIGFTPLQQTLLFDFPLNFQIIQELVTDYPVKSLEDLKTLSPEALSVYAKADKTPTWKGVDAMLIHWPSTGWHYLNTVPMFEKIKQGEVWRLITPIFLHRDFLHILFNMIWLWILGRQIEQRLSKGKMVLLVLFIGIISNVAQYLMSGPIFFGFSGVAVGMGGFIWMRQKVAPWEGYPLHRATLLFLLFFVIAMFVLEVGSFILEITRLSSLSANIGNTAHIVGGAVGIFLGRLPFFARKGVKPK